MTSPSISFRGGAHVIAVVDDEEEVRMAVERLLKMSGYDVAAFASAEMLLSSGRLQHIRCLITDIRMPRMSGFDLQSRLSERGYQIPTIIITAYCDENMRIRAREAGAIAFLEKPLFGADLLERVRVCLESS